MSLAECKCVTHLGWQSTGRRLHLCSRNTEGGIWVDLERWRPLRAPHLCLVAWSCSSSPPWSRPAHGTVIRSTPRSSNCGKAAPTSSWYWSKGCEVEHASL